MIQNVERVKSRIYYFVSAIALSVVMLAFIIMFCDWVFLTWDMLFNPPYYLTSTLFDRILVYIKYPTALLVLIAAIGFCSIIFTIACVNIRSYYFKLKELQKYNRIENNKGEK